jgi:hypothetical protein
LEARTANDCDIIDQPAQDALRQVWYLEEKTFCGRLLNLVDRAKGPWFDEAESSRTWRQDYGKLGAEAHARQSLGCRSSG